MSSRAVIVTGYSLFAAALMAATAALAGEDLPVEKAILTSPPLVPPAIERTRPARVTVELEVVEKVGKLADGVEYTFWTFGGSVPGRFIRVREGDTVELTLENHPNNRLPHNIDLHAVSGPGGGAASTFTAPGHKSRFTFKALNPGLYVYHCATAPVGMHVANGMYGMIYVQPKDNPLPKVDREYYVVQGDFYTPGNFGAKGRQDFSMTRAIDENPSYVVFNGSATSLVGDNALKAKVGETVRLFVGNGGPNLTSSFHVIGAIFDTVHFEGGMKSQEQVQTTMIPSGGSAIVDFKVQTAGTYILVDHSLLRAFNKGALGMLKAEGEENKLVYSGKESDDVYLGDQAVAENIAATKDGKQTTLTSASTPKPDGRKLFSNNCQMCHQSEGQGIPGAFPPLANSDFLAAISGAKDRSKVVQIVTQGFSGKVTVNGKEFNGIMTPVSGLTDENLATLLTFVTNTWGNKARPFTAAEVGEYRAKLKNGKSDDKGAH